MCLNVLRAIRMETGLSGRPSITKYLLMIITEVTRAGEYSVQDSEHMGCVNEKHSEPRSVAFSSFRCGSAVT